MCSSYGQGYKRERRPPIESVRKALELNRIQSKAHLYHNENLSEGSRFSIAKELSRVFEAECMTDWKHENEDQGGAEKGNEEDTVVIQQVQMKLMALRGVPKLEGPIDGKSGGGHFVFTGSDEKPKITITDI